MAPPTINGRAAVNGQARFPWRGVWYVEATLVAGDDPPPPKGARVTLQLGDLTLSGTVSSSGTPADGRPRVEIFGGANRWRSELPRRPAYAIATGVPLRLVVEDIARDQGEQVEIAPALRGAVLGASWSRLAEAAIVALRRVRVGSPPKPLEFHVRPDGVTWIGDRLTFTPAGVELVARKVDPANGWAQIVSPTDAVSALLPGSLVPVEGLPAEPVRETAVFWNDRELVVEISQHDGMADTLSTTQQLAAQMAALYGAHLYQVVGDTGGPRVPLRALEAADGFPDELSVEKAFGVPGLRAQLTKGALVLVTWRNRDPAQPQVVGYIPGVLPQEVRHDAAELLELGPSVPDLAAGAGVHVGGGSRPVAMGDTVAPYLEAVHNLLAEIVARITPPDPGNPADADYIAAIAAEDFTYDQGQADFVSRKLGTA